METRIIECQGQPNIVWVVAEPQPLIHLPTPPEYEPIIQEKPILKLAFHKEPEEPEKPDELYKPQRSWEISEGWTTALMVIVAVLQGLGILIGACMEVFVNSIPGDMC
jgi:hypothetical protein